jgi:hypothetical protein
MLPGSRNTPYQPSQPSNQAQNSPLASVHPPLMGGFDFASVDAGSGAGLPPAQQSLVGGAHHYPQDPSYQQPLPSPRHQQPLHSPHHLASRGSYFSQPSPVHTSPPTHFMREANANYEPPQHYSQPSTSYQQVPVSYQSAVDSKPIGSRPLPQHSLYQHGQHSTSQADEHASHHSHSSVSPRGDYYPVLQRYNSHPQVAAHLMQVNSADMSQAGSYSHTAAVYHADHNHSTYPPDQTPMHDMNPDVKYMPQAQVVLGMSRV